LLVVVAGGLFPDLVGDRYGAVADAGGSLGERQCGALGVVEVRGLSPGRYGEQPLVGLAELAGDVRVAGRRRRRSR